MADKRPQVDAIAWETFGHVGNKESGEAFNRVVGAETTSRIAHDSADPTIIYIGESVPGTATDAADWKISRINTSIFSELWPNGSTLYDFIWDDRESLSYA